MLSRRWRHSTHAWQPGRPAWLLIAAILTAMVGTSFTARAITQLPEPDPKPGSYGLSATKPQAPPKVGARISSPTNGQGFSESPITVEGICPNGLLVEVYNNNVMVGATMCENGSFRLQVSLFTGQNELYALVYDSTDQVGPESNRVTITYNNTNIGAFGQQITLTSVYSRRAASINRQLVWPLQLSGGTGPYALTIDWGDGSPDDLKSQPVAGTFDINHIYKRAGIYTVNIKVVDSNGVSAFLQLVAVANGEPAPAGPDGSDTVEKSSERLQILWIPVIVSAVMLPVSYWLGRRSQLVSIRMRLEKERDNYQDGS